MTAPQQRGSQERESQETEAQTTTTFLLWFPGVRHPRPPCSVGGDIHEARQIQRGGREGVLEGRSRFFCKKSLEDGVERGLGSSRKCRLPR